MAVLRSWKTRIIALVLATVIWLTCLPAIYRHKAAGWQSTGTLSTTARALLTHQTGLWTDPAARQREVDAMRRSNPEWDFMGRTFLVWALANAALREPDHKSTYLASMDQIIDDTLARQQRNGMYYFLMSYAHEGRYVQQPARSQFEDGEIALMLGMRRIVEEKPAYRDLQLGLVRTIVDRMESSPTLSCESYPNECWTFCNSAALAAIATSDYLDGTDHRDLFHRWIDFARTHLTDPQTGLLISAYTIDGAPLYGPEGSSIWFVCHCLDIVDPAFAAGQYALAKRVLKASVGGFDYAREWPRHWRGSNVIDSGFVFPGLDISAGSTGMSLLAASTFHDTAFLAGLAATMDFGGFPIDNRHGLQYAAGNQVSDAVFLYSSVMGPVWDKVREGKGR